MGFWGVIVRSNLHVNPTTGAKNNYNWYTKIDFGKITDGSSNTLVLGEKFLSPSVYEGSTDGGLMWHDDKGWTDGWDPDTLRSTICTFIPDREISRPPSAPDETRWAGFRFGSAHANGMNTAFADGSVRTITYDVEQELLNRLGHRSDDEGADMGAL